MAFIWDLTIKHIGWYSIYLRHIDKCRLFDDCRGWCQEHSLCTGYTPVISPIWSELVAPCFCWPMMYPLYTHGPLYNLPVWTNSINYCNSVIPLISLIRPHCTSSTYQLLYPIHNWCNNGIFIYNIRWYRIHHHAEIIRYPIYTYVCIYIYIHTWTYIKEYVHESAPSCKQPYKPYRISLLINQLGCTTLYQ